MGNTVVTDPPAALPTHTPCIPDFFLQLSREMEDELRRRGLFPNGFVAIELGFLVSYVLYEKRRLQVQVSDNQTC